MAGVDPPEPGDPVCSQPSLSSLHWSTFGHLESCSLSDLLRGRFKEHNIDDISLQSLWSCFSPPRGFEKRLVPRVCRHSWPTCGFPLSETRAHGGSARQGLSPQGCTRGGTRTGPTSPLAPTSSHTTYFANRLKPRCEPPAHCPGDSEKSFLAT